MATVVSKTSIKIDELIEGTIVTGYVNDDGQLVLENRIGGQILAGNVLRAYDFVPFSVPGVLSVQDFQLTLTAVRETVISEVVVTVGSAPAGSSIVVDVLKNDVTIFTDPGDRPTILAGELEGSGVPDVTAVAVGDKFKVSVISVGSGTPGSDLVVQVVGT